MTSVYRDPGFTHTFAVRHRAVSLIECVLSMAVFAVLICSVMNAAGAAVATRALGERREQARFLADQLLAEIMSEPYAATQRVEQVVSAKYAVLGIKLGVEVSPRVVVTNAESVDRYNRFADTKPVTESGEVVQSGATGFLRSASVEWVSPGDPSVISTKDQGIKRVTVIVSFQGKPLSKRVGFVFDGDRSF
ncbi:MAG: hypothetical protein K2X32_03090 [Phycisphaerales bacterium]|nr:hypothetical protein [Phycisphaerales bacterium]